jgi:hypothetical protein
MKCTACGANSQTTDFCDQCGADFAGSAAAASPAGQPVASVAPAGATAAGGEKCPACSEPRVDDARYCEACAYDFVSGSAAGAPQAQPAAAVVTPVAPVTATATADDTGWWVVVTADPDWYDRNGSRDQGFEFPADFLPRQLPLSEASVRIGRKSGGGIDLSAAPRDNAISGEHATLIRQDDGSYQIVDYRSSNGTFLNGAADALAKGLATDLADGDFVNIGAWTKLTFEQR